MHLSRTVTAFTLIALSAFASILRAQSVVTQDPKDQNVRLAWLTDADGGAGNQAWAGFEIAYASRIYPLDQMIISYAHTAPESGETNAVMLSLEEYYPLSETVVPYGVAGLGYMWTDYDHNRRDEDQGWYAKIGGGLQLKLCEAADLYGELTYQVSNEELWADGSDQTANNLVALIGLRFKY